MTVESQHLPRLVQALTQPDAYPSPVEKVTTAETHVSYLFFTGEFVYKIKKPVDYGFLDFTTLEKRRFYCQREVELNSRLSPDVYLSVVPICYSDNRYRVNGSGDVVEYAVKMRELPHEKALDQILKRGELSEEVIRRVAVRISNFHENAAVGPEVTKLGDLDVVRQNIEENFEQTERFVGTCLTQDEFDDIECYSQSFMETMANVFHQRAKEGRIRDGHGDLHTSNIFLDDDIHFIDCIEFNDRFRCADVTEDIAFLAMDLDHHGRSDLSEVFVSAYVEAAHDAGVYKLLNFFKVYRAFVRGKVTSFRLDDSALSEKERSEIQAAARSYFRLARSYTEIFPKPCLILVSGIMGSGKTSVSQELARRWNMVHISSDLVRKELAGVKPAEHRYEAYGEGIYSAQFTQKTYKAMYRKAYEKLTTGNSVVLDATFREGHERRAAVDMSREAGAETWIVECVASDDETRRRLLRRTEGKEQTASDGRWELFQQQKAEWEPVKEVPQRNHILLDTSGTHQESIKNLLRLLYASVLTI